MGPGIDMPRWSIARRVLFRFVFAYLVLYQLPFPIPLPWYGDLWNAVVPWVGRRLFRVDITVRPNGSGDTTYNYVQVCCFLVLAAAVTLLWSVLDRKRPGHPRLHDGLRIYVRFALASAMIMYGAVKVIPAQFPAPSLDRLLQPFGDASPMGLLWTFMGASVGYNLFAGLGELAGGLLLTTRRTTLLGALVCLGVLSNVVVLNFCYDVPVKLFSLHLLAMAAFLVAPDLGRLVSLFLLNRGTEPADCRPLFQRRWLQRGVLALRTVLVVGLTAYSLYVAYQARRAYADLAAGSPLHGIWNVEEFVVDGAVRAPLVTDATRWRRVVFDYPGVIAVQLMSDSRSRYVLALHTDTKTLELTKRDDPAWKAAISYKQPEPELLVLDGTFDGHTIRARLCRADDTSFLLVTRGFHWINEYPFNR
jgi:hypothetical protein